MSPILNPQRRNRGVSVRWETTNLPFHVDGSPRRYGRFVMASAWRAWIWGVFFCLRNPRGAVHVERI